MSGLEPLFLEKIEAEPDVGLHCEVYADWLEEHGRLKAGQVRAWCEARQNLTKETVQSLTSLVGERLKILNSLSDRHQRQCACEFAWEVLPAFESEKPNYDSPRRSIVAAWKFSLGELPLSDMLYARSAATAAASSTLWSTSSAAASAAAWSASSDANTAAWSASSDAAWDPFSAAGWAASRRKQILIASSYMLFGCNALPGRFDLETAELGLGERMHGV